MRTIRMNQEAFTDAQGHFAFGENWASFASAVSEEHILEAEKALRSLLGVDSLAGLTFLDIGSGSGLHSLAALRLGAKMVLALDVDADSVATTVSVLAKHAPPGAVYQVRRDSILSETLSVSEQFDVVYSWGVLHHTGQMHKAITNAAALVKPHGLLAIALYGKTVLCRAWKVEKKFYSRAPDWIQRVFRWLFVGLFQTALLLTGRSFKQYVARYSRQRGMDYLHDVHDWLGGWPYESISPPELRDFMSGLGFAEVNCNLRAPRLGIFGSGCDEYVFRREN